MQKTISVVNLSAIRQNALKIREIIGDRFFYAVVKANAYGHGAERVAHALQDVADGFCVAIMDEGIALRAAGIDKPVLVLTPPLDGNDIERARFYDLTVSVGSLRTAGLARGLNCHVSVNTGMNRYGCNVEYLRSVLKELKRENIQGIYSHLFAAENDAASARQLEIFTRAERIARKFNPYLCAHVSASGGTLRGGGFLKDGVRCGLLLYGYAPSGFENRGFIPALKVYARRAHITRFMDGGVGYNFADAQYTTLCTYRAGYADGFKRGVPLGEKTLCMDSFVRKGGGEWLCILSDAEKYARACGTIPYEVLTEVTRRSEIIYE